MITDLTVGKPSRVLWKFALPLLGSVVFQQLYNISDSIIAGKFAGVNALAAIGVSYPITMIFMAIAMGCNIGASVIISQLFGNKKISEMKTAVYTSFLMTAVTSIVLLAFGVIFCKPMLNLLNTPADILSDGAEYLNIFTYGLPLLFFYNVSSGVFTALGDSRTPLYLLIFSSVANIILDLLFVAQYQWGVAGAAWATFIAQGVSSIISTALVFIRLKTQKCENKPKIFDKEIFKSILVVTIPSILQQSFVSVGNLFIQNIINGYGSGVIAGYSAAIKLNTFAITSFAAAGNAISSYTAQNTGAKKPDRIKSGYKSGLIMVLIIAAPFILFYFLLSRQAINLFVDPEDGRKAITTGIQFLKVVSPFYIMVSIKIFTDGLLRGAGCMKAFMVSTFADLIIRVILSYILSAQFDVLGVWLSWPIGWTIATGISYMFYRKVDWESRMSIY